jgi:hypothetical protein
MEVPNQQIVNNLVRLLKALASSDNPIQQTNIAQDIIRQSTNHPNEYAVALHLFNQPNQQGGSKISRKRYSRLSTKRKSRNTKKKIHKKLY